MSNGHKTGKVATTFRISVYESSRLGLGEYSRIIFYSLD